MNRLAEKHCFLNKEFTAYEILPWLPYKDLCKFKTVCKLWGDTISNDPNFSTFQSQNSQSSLVVCAAKSQLFFLPTTTQNPQSFPTQNLDSMFKDYNYINFVASNNGFLCGFASKSFKRHIFVYNPLTKYHKIIHLRPYFLTLGFAFNPREQCYYVVCPYLSKTNMNDVFADTCFKVCSSKESGGWRTSMAKLEGVGRRMSTEFHDKSACKSVFVHGKLYWMMSREDLLWYDVKSESAGTLVAPCCSTEGKGESIQIGECEGELSYTMLVEGSMRVWVLKRNAGRESKWIMKYEIDVELLAKGELRSFVRRRPMPFVGGDIVLFSKRTGLCSYNLITKEVKSLADECSKHYVYSIHSYKPSLAHLPD